MTEKIFNDEDDHEQEEDQDLIYDAANGGIQQ
jgi:hypothetical protein